MCVQTCPSETSGVLGLKRSYICHQTPASRPGKISEILPSCKIFEKLPVPLSPLSLCSPLCLRLSQSFFQCVKSAPSRSRKNWIWNRPLSVCLGTDRCGVPLWRCAVSCPFGIDWMFICFVWNLDRHSRLFVLASLYMLHNGYIDNFGYWQWWGFS